jgi:hypothetical protein
MHPKGGDPADGTHRKNGHCQRNAPTTEQSIDPQRTAGGLNSDGSEKRFDNKKVYTYL